MPIFYLAPKSTLSDDNELDEEKPSGELEEHQSGLEAYKSGWIFVTRDYIESPDEINSNTQLITESNDNKSAYSALYKLVKDLATKNSKTIPNKKSLNKKKFLDHDDNDLDELNKDTFALPRIIVQTQNRIATINVMIHNHNIITSRKINHNNKLDHHRRSIVTLLF